MVQYLSHAHLLCMNMAVSAYPDSAETSKINPLETPETDLLLAQ